jgi:hypothetical protein
MKWSKLRMRILKPLQLKDSWIVFFILGIIMMNYPFISIFNKPRMVFHLPLLYIYLQVGWLVSILVIFLFTKASNLPKEDGDDKGEHF